MDYPTALKINSCALMLFVLLIGPKRGELKDGLKAFVHAWLLFSLMLPLLFLGFSYGI